jgi:uncharacterized protein YbjT (DUF2867 family)
MTNVLVLGAGGQIARRVIAMLDGHRDVQLTLLLRDGRKLASTPQNASLVEGDVLDGPLLARAMRDQDVVYVNLAGDVDLQLRSVLETMKAAGVRRVIMVNAMGIYDEVPGKFGEWNRREIGAELVPYRRAADLIESSGTDYTILRAAWLTDADEIDYETTERSEPFKGTEVSRKSVASLVVEAILSPELWSDRNLGVNKPGTDGDKPSFM